MQRKSYFAIVSGLIIIIALASVSYSPVVHNGFVNWDDDRMVTQTSLIRDVSFNGITTIFSSFHNAHYHPLVTLSYAIEYYFSELNPSVYHISNIILHIFNSLLVFIVIYNLTEKRFWIALLTSILFSVHPINVESVAWITERKDVLYTLFFLISLQCYLLYVRKGEKQLFLWCSFVVFIFSCFSKVSAVTLPVVLLLVDYFIERKFSRKNILEKIPFFTVAVIIGIVNIYAQYESYFQGTEFSIPAYSFLNRVVVPLYALAFYLYKIIVPINFSAFYPYPAEINGTLPFIYYCFAFLSLCGLIVFIILFFQKKILHAVVFGSGFLFITISPTLQFTPVGMAITADRFAYVPAIGLFFLAGFFIDLLQEKFATKQRVLQVIFAFCACSIVLLSYATYTRSALWRNDVTLFSDVIEQFPNAVLSYVNIGLYYQQRNDDTNAVMYYEKALRVDSTDAETYNNLGIVYQRNAQPEKAIIMFKKVLQFYPTSVDAYNNLGLAFAAKEEFDKAEHNYKQALTIDSNYSIAYGNLANVYYNQEKYQDAIRAFQKAILKGETSFGLYNKIGASFATIGESDSAKYYYSQALQKNPLAVEVYNNIAVLMIEKAEYDSAITYLQQAVELQPNYAFAYKNLGLAYLKKNARQQAMDAFQKAAALGDRDVIEWLKSNGL
ncbi:MAG: tetratricopeptide repeat protein [Bacteroidota bacterium]|mgnify:CR=1 FL=1